MATDACRSSWATSCNDAPAFNVSVAAVWRSRWAWTVPRPARRAARATMQVMLTRSKGVNGATARTNTVRAPVRGRPRRKYSTTASPTSTGNGNRSVREPLPWIVRVPARQSMSDSSIAATSAQRSPSRRNSVMTAMSRRPTALVRSHASSNACT
ncbi:hypothetical protein GALL_361870 [mine drainage metagenome]|uniref:Uncharacterized protein n=1 Tax=mine drainage metagenome TaxID=410659 RepID=A0A1J5QX31_9ZZZZ